MNCLNILVFYFFFFSTLFIKANSSWLIFKATKALEIKTFMLLNLYLLTILFYHASFFFLIIDLYFLIPAAILQIFKPIAEFVIPIEIPSKEAKVEIEIYSVTAEAKIRKCPT